MELDLQDYYNQATLLTVGGHTDNGLGYADEELVGKIACNGVDFSVLPHWGFTTDDMLYGGRPFDRHRKYFELELPPLDNPHRYDSLVIGGPRWFFQPVQDETVAHQLYMYWRPRKERPDSTVDLGLNCPVDIGLSSPWTSVMGRTARGVVVGQVISAGKLITHLTLTSYSVRNKDLPQDTVFLKPRHVSFEGTHPPEQLLWAFERNNMLEQVRAAITLFGRHCSPTDVGNAPPYWETLYEDLMAACWETTSHQDWLSASDWICTPWDIIAYCEIWCRDAGVPSNGGLTNTVEGMYTKLRRRLPASRQAQLDALWLLTYQYLHWSPRPKKPKR